VLGILLRHLQDPSGGAGDDGVVPGQVLGPGERAGECFLLVDNHLRAGFAPARRPLSERPGWRAALWR
jgi:hypothetical protein